MLVCNNILFQKLHPVFSVFRMQKMLWLLDTGLIPGSAHLLLNILEYFHLFFHCLRKSQVTQYFFQDDWCCCGLLKFLILCQVFKIKICNKYEKCLRLNQKHFQSTKGIIQTFAYLCEHVASLLNTTAVVSVAIIIVSIYF